MAVRLCGAALADAPEWSRVLIVIDQLEELFTVTAPSKRNAFVRTLEAISGFPRAVTIATLRADFVPSAASWPRLADLLRDGHYLLLAPGLRALSDIITLPAARAGIPVEPGLLERMVEDAGFQAGILPLLAYTLEQLYNLEGGRGLTCAGYDALGGLRGAISQRANESLRTLDEPTRAALPRLFRTLLSVNSAGIVTRRRALQSDVVTDGAMTSLVAQLVDARLLIAIAATRRTPSKWRTSRCSKDGIDARVGRGEPRVPALAEPVAAPARRLGGQRPRRERRASGGALQEAVRWLERSPSDLDADERAFIEWPRSEEFRIRRVVARVRELLTSPSDRVSRGGELAWLTVLVLAGEEKEIDRLTVESADRTALLDEARANAAVSLAQAGELDAALTLIRETRGLGRAAAAARVAEIAAATGHADVAESAALLAEDQALAKRAMARASAARSGIQEQFVLEILSQSLRSDASAAAYLRGTIGLDAMLTDADATPSSAVLRTGQLAQVVRELGGVDESRSLVGAIEASLASVEESWWRGLAAGLRRPCSSGCRTRFARSTATR